jgi:hypothetical protein
VVAVSLLKNKNYVIIVLISTDEILDFEIQNFACIEEGSYCISFNGAIKLLTDRIKTLHRS